MCGIAAIFSRRGKKDLSAIVPMTTVIKHRGPDDEGFALFTNPAIAPQLFGGPDTPEKVYSSPLSYCPKKRTVPSPMEGIAAISNRRLAIVDLSAAGHQPMCSDDGLLWLAYNGEIYNHLEIRDELEHLGYTFQSHSDTETILSAYREWGVRCLSRFNGMFSFVLIDQRKEKVLVARDRFGVKPLYYWKSPDGLLAFASEIKQFTTLPGWNAQLNPQRAYDFLNWGVFDHTHETLFSGVEQLRGGEYFEFPLHQDDDATDVLYPHRWYSLTPPPFEGTQEEAATEFRSLLEDAVRLRLRADVDVGSCLSGGLDSSSIVCLANDLLREKEASNRQKTFSACSKNPLFDERHFIDMVVTKTNVDAHYTYPSLDSLFEELGAIIWHQDEPFSSTSIFAQWEVFKLANRGKVKVMLDGQGADEQLAGYHGFFGNYFYDLFRTLQWTKLCSEMHVAKKMHPHLRPLFLLTNKLVPDAIRQPLRKAFGKSSTNPKWIDSTHLKFQDHNPFCHTKADTLLAQSRQQLFHSNLPMLLHYEDRDSMAHSIESRTPFLDYRVVEFSLSLPAHYKIASGWTKRVMREGMQDTLPDAIRLRTDKMAFVTPEEEWMRQHAPEKFREALKESIAHSKGILNAHAATYLEEMIAGKRAFNFLPWRMICFGKWMKDFEVKI